MREVGAFVFFSFAIMVSTSRSQCRPCAAAQRVGSSPGLEVLRLDGGRLLVGMRHRQSVTARIHVAEATSDGRTILRRRAFPPSSCVFYGIVKDVPRLLNISLIPNGLL